MIWATKEHKFRFGKNEDLELRYEPIWESRLIIKTRHTNSISISSYTKVGGFTSIHIKGYYFFCIIKSGPGIFQLWWYWSVQFLLRLADFGWKRHFWWYETFWINLRAGDQIKLYIMKQPDYCSRLNYNFLIFLYSHI